MRAMWLLAWRNLWRNRARTIITLSAISVTYALMLLSYGIGEASYIAMMESAVKSAGGSVLVHADGYWESQGSELVMDDGEALADRLAELPGVTTAVPRVIINGLLSSPRGNAGARVMGIDPAREAKLSDPARFLAHGDFLDGAGGEKRPLVLGRGLVDDLGLELGDRVVLTATDPQGEMTRALFHLSGIMETGSDMMDGSSAYTTLAAAQAAVGMDGKLTQIGVVLPDDHQRQAARAAVVAAIDGQRGLEILTWDEALPELVGWVEVDYRMNVMFMFLILLVVAFGIANTFLMAVKERIRELGLLAALGMTPGRIARLVLAETLILCAIAIAIGLALGYSAHYYFANTGIELSALSDLDYEISGVLMEDMALRSRFNAVKWVSATVGVFVLVMLSAFYPAFRATRVEPATAMRTYE